MRWEEDRTATGDTRQHETKQRPTQQVCFLATLVNTYPNNNNKDNDNNNGSKQQTTASSSIVEF